MLDRAPQQFVGYARDTHTHTHICANLLTELVSTQTQWESGRARALLRVGTQKESTSAKVATARRAYESERVECAQRA